MRKIFSRPTVQKMDKPLSVYACGIDLPHTGPHPNRVPFRGVLTFLDTPSDKAIIGSKEHKVIVTRKAAQKALPSLIGMGINYCGDLAGHNQHSKCGLITKAEIAGNQVLVYGFVYSADCPDLVRLAAREDLGMSYELKDVYVPDMREEVWRLDKLTFTGAAVLKREKAAYKSTSFKIV